MNDVSKKELASSQRSATNDDSPDGLQRVLVFRTAADRARAALRERFGYDEDQLASIASWRSDGCPPQTRLMRAAARGVEDEVRVRLVLCLARLSGGWCPRSHGFVWVCVWHASPAGTGCTL